MAPAQRIHRTPGELARAGPADQPGRGRLTGRDGREDYLQGRTVEQAAADTWKLKVQRLALEVLYVYKAPVPDYVADSLIPR